MVEIRNSWVEQGYYSQSVRVYVYLMSLTAVKVSLEA